MNPKIQPSHLERTAVIYIRQSTMHQVRHHKESQRRQYGLKDRARELGFQRVEVIDDDQGRSGSGSDERPGFMRLVGLVCRGEVGAVLAIEASRLARNNRDWHHLVDLCAMTDTLVMDHDGIYDPRLLNDRLLLGLKGTMSEFELSLWRQRAQEALRQMIHRGEVLWQVPVGYTRTEDNGIEMTPDMQVQDAIRGVFAKFAELGSVRQVLLWYRQRELPLPTLCAERGEWRVVWRLPVYKRVHSVLTNPTYAGAFVYGRRCTQTKVVNGRARKTAGHALPREEWQVIINDHHDAYISWETFLSNQRQIESNVGRHHQGGGSAGRGAAKSGPALLAGLLRCARCGRKLHVGYSGNGGRVPRYSCRGAHLNHGKKMCISFGGLKPDQHVSETVLEALQPLGVQAAIDARSRMQLQDDQERRTIELAIEKARYEADRARRQYDAVEPENRLVAVQLEQRWNQALQQVDELESRLAAVAQGRLHLSDDQHSGLLAMGDDLRLLWHHPDASAAIKKRILRTVVKEIVVDICDEPPEIRMTLHWAGGVHTPLIIPRNRKGQHQRCTDRKVVELVSELAKVCDDTNIASLLNRLGYRTGADNTWTESRVRSLRNQRGIPAFDPQVRGDWLTMKEAAEQLTVSPPVIRRLIDDGILPAKQVIRSAPWVIQREDLDLPAVQSAVNAVKTGRRSPRSVDAKTQVPLFQPHDEV